MKKILLATVAILALAACNRDIIIPETPVDKDHFVLEYSVVIPEAQAVTKSLATPEITGMKVFVFDENGLLVDQPATATASAWGEDTTPTTFTVTLPQHSRPCSVHFIANCPDAAGVATENDLTALYTATSQDAYWQCVEVPDLLASNDALKNALVEEYFTNIPLIRNYAKVTVDLALPTNPSYTFTDMRYMLINVPDRGSVVPFNTNNGQFVNYYEEVVKEVEGKNVVVAVGLGYDDLKDDKNYDGFMPAGATYDETTPDYAANSTRYVEELAALYTYESKLRSAKNTALIIYGKYNGTAGYYKLDFINGDDVYAVLRNLHYKVTINEVTGKGYSSAAAAAAAAAGNNISASSETENLLNITDGTQRLTVDEVVKYIVKGGEAGQFTIRYKYEKQLGTASNTAGTITRSKNATDADAVIAAGGIGAPVYGTDGWFTVTITPKALPASASEQYTEKVTIKVGNLSRVVTLKLRQPYDMRVACDKTTSTALGQSVKVSVTIPGDLNEEIFPLVFDMEDDQLCLSPDASYAGNQGAVPVTNDVSIIDSSKETFHFKRTLTWAQYSAITAGTDGKKTFNTVFKTSKTTAANTTIKVYVYHELFGTKNNPEEENN